MYSDYTFVAAVFIYVCACSFKQKHIVKKVNARGKKNEISKIAFKHNTPPPTACGCSPRFSIGFGGLAFAFGKTRFLRLKYVQTPQCTRRVSLLRLPRTQRNTIVRWQTTALCTVF